jgi:hypothetical protein
MKKDENSPDGVQHAVVEFGSESAAKTALLLTHALIVDRPITVDVFTGQVQVQVSPSAQAAQTAVAEQAAKPYDVADDERSKTSVVVSLMAAGYVVGTEALQKAKDLDEKHMISLQLKVGAEMLKAKAHELDQQYHISEKAQALKNAAEAKAKSVDEKYHITEKATMLKDTAAAGAASLAQKAQQNETVQKGVAVLAAVGASIKQKVQEVKDETLKVAAEKQQAAAASTVTSTTAEETAAPAVAAPANPQ